MLKLAKLKRLLLDWQPFGAGLVCLVALGWWLVLGWPLRRSLRGALGRAGGTYPAGRPTRPRRPKDRPRPSCPRVPYPSAA